MKQFVIQHNNSVFYIFLLAVALFPILPMGIESVLMFTGFLYSLIYFFFEGHKFWNKEKTIQLFLFSSLFLIYLYSLIYTKDIQAGIKLLTRLLPTILFPAIFLFNDKNILKTDRFDKITSLYCGAVFLGLIYLHIALFNKLYDPNINFWDFRQLIESKIKVHGTYLAMWVGFAIIVLVYKIRNKIAVKIKDKSILILLFLILYFFYWQYLIGARMPFFATIIICFAVLFRNIKNIIISVVILIVVSTIMVLKTDRIGERFERLKNYNLSFPEGKYEDNYPNISNEQIRNGIYFCSYETIKKEPVLGYGIGDVEVNLQSCYDNTFTNTDTYKVTKYNSHNQYLNIILASGIIGLILFFLSNFYFLKIAFNRKLGMYISFLFFIFLNCCFENILSRHDGVIFFSFFNSLLFFKTTI